MYLEQWKWNRKDRNKLYQSIEELLDMKHSQFYYARRLCLYLGVTA